MDVIKFCKEMERMTQGCGIDCNDCPLARSNNGTELGCRELQYYKPEKCVSIVEEWSKAHPKKTRQSELLKMFPNAVLDDRGIVKLSPCRFGYTCSNSKMSDGCRECSKEFWLEEIEEEEENAEIH